jgi:serpin B
LVLLALIAEVPSTAASEPPDPKSDVAEVVQGNNEFAFDLYAKLRDKPGNLCFSPASISTALARTYAGARGETADEMAKTLHLMPASDKLHPAFHTLLDQLNGAGNERSYRQNLANALWGRKGFGFLPAFLELTKKNYGAGLREIDFQGNPEAARKTINAWVEERTQEKIKELLKPGTLDSYSRLVLTNAIYFKGDWDRPFHTRATRKETFHVSSEKTTDAMMMHATSNFRYLDGGAFQALEMPYKGKDLSMVVLLPKQLDGLADFENTLTAARLADWLPEMRGRQVAVSLPKFKTTSAFSLKYTLSAMGMKQAFREDGADFSGLSREENLYLSAVVHKSLVDVNEEGTVAAAATAAGVMKARAIAKRVEIAKFTADHPFVFLIRDNHTGSILFLGRIVKPQG